MKTKTLSFILVCALLLGTAACLSSAVDESTQEPIVGMPNPSAVYCEGLGYTTETVIRDGGEDADCIFPDNSRCAAWDFLSGRCGQEHSFCVSQGFVLIENNTNIGTCQFPDGSTCDEYLYFTGECSPGDNP